jgi:hypothetical protein
LLLLLLQVHRWTEARHGFDRQHHRWRAHVHDCMLVSVVYPHGAPIAADDAMLHGELAVTWTDPRSVYVFVHAHPQHSASARADAVDVTVTVRAERDGRLRCTVRGRVAHATETVAMTLLREISRTLCVMPPTSVAYTSIRVGKRVFVGCTHDSVLRSVVFTEDGGDT